MRIRLLILLFILIPFTLYSAPAVTGLSGTLTHGSSVAISGTGFGTKTTAAPVTWETFETGGSNLTEISGTKGWLKYNENSTTPVPPAVPHYSTIGAHSGSFCSRFLTSSATFQGIYKTNLSSDEIYYTCWYKLIMTGDKGSVGIPLKFIRLTTGTDPYVHPSGGSSFGWTTKDSNAGVKNYWFLEDDTGTQGSRTVTPGTNEEKDDNEIAFCMSHTPADREPKSGQEWGRVEVYIKQSTAGVADGIVSFWWNGVRIYNYTTVNTRSAGHTQKWTSYLMPMMPQDQGSVTFDIRVDDFYVDGTQSRVEIGNASTWTACTHKEVQPATAWNSNGQSITVTLNRGSFGVSDPAYVYVIDSNGSVNSNGKAITFGQMYGGGDSTPPNAPAGVSLELIP